MINKLFSETVMTRHREKLFTVLPKLRNQHENFVGSHVTGNPVKCFRKNSPGSGDQLHLFFDIIRIRC